MTIKFAKEPWSETIEEMKPLFPRHWEELAAHKDIHEGMNYTVYELAEKMGQLWLYTVRDDAKLVGYAIFFVRPPLHYKQSVWAACDMMWVASEARKPRVGQRFVKFFEADLRANGVAVINIGEKIVRPALGRLLVSEDFVPIETHYQKRLS